MPRWTGRVPNNNGLTLRMRGLEKAAAFRDAQKPSSLLHFP